MATQANILEHLVLSMLTQGSAPKRKDPAALAFLLAALLALAGVGFLMAASYNWLLTTYDLQTAQIYTGGLALALALFISGIAMAIHSYKRRKVQAYYDVVKNNLHTALNVFGDELEDPIRENPKTAMLMAGLAGYIAAEKLLH